MKDRGMLLLHFAQKTVSIKPGKPSFVRLFFVVLGGRIFMKDHGMLRLRFSKKTVPIKPEKPSFLRLFL